MSQNYRMKLTPAFNLRKVDGWWAAWVEEIPGVNSQGKTRENLKDALRMVLEANKELSEKEQEATTREEFVLV
jgi:predicted RNase H-like HicB family nuclease